MSKANETLRLYYNKRSVAEGDEQPNLKMYVQGRNSHVTLPSVTPWALMLVAVGDEKG
jgi:hypothetical protein